MDKDKHLIVGAGEIGGSLWRVLVEHYKVIVAGKHETKLDDADVLHICFPYSEEFIFEVKRYQELYEPKFTVVHSTTPVGTCSKVEATHSPVRGVHPNLEEGIKTFHKFLGGPEASQVAGYFRRAGMKVILFDKQETTEALKLFDTEYYRTCIEFCHRVKKYCDEHNLNFSEVYTIPNLTYNEGYTKLEHPEFVRPVLQPIMTKIGGHCVLDNTELIKLSENQ